MTPFIKSNLSNKVREAKRIISNEGIRPFLRAASRYVIYHLSIKWRFVYFEFMLKQQILSFELKEPMTVRIATSDDMDRIQSELFPVLYDDLAYDRRYFELIGQEDVKCFLAEFNSTFIHYSWVFLDVFKSPLMDIPFDKRKLRKDDALIGPVFTNPSVRGMLIYPYVLVTILRYLKENDYATRAIVFFQGRTAAAVSFYKRLGFREIVNAQPPSILSYLLQRSRWQGNALKRK